MCPAGRSSPKTYQTRRAWASFVRATKVTRHGTATWTWLHSPREKTSRILAEQDAHPVAKYWRDENRCWCCGSTGRSCYDSPSGRSPVDCSTSRLEANECLVAARWKRIL